MKNDLGIEERLRRKMSRDARTQSVATRFTKAEEMELLQAAQGEGKTLREWTRDALLREARKSKEDPILTEIMANRLILTNALRGLLLGETWTAESFRHLTDTVRKEKHRAAKELLQQYAQRDEL